MKGQRGNIKIGVSKNPYDRLKELQTGHSAKLKIIEMFPFESRMQAYATEKQLHRRYQRHKVRGEWFKYDMYLEFKGRLEKIEGARKLIRDNTPSQADIDALKWGRDFL